MQRIAVAPRPQLAAICAREGFTFHEIEGRPYWDESAYYGFTLDQIERDIEAATSALAGLCKQLTDRAVRDTRLLSRLGVPEAVHDLVRASYETSPALYGRFDFAYDGTSPPKLLEFNADTPTALYEAAVFQWGWLEDSRGRALPATADQYNSIHDTLVAHWPAVAGHAETVHFAAMRNAEDFGTIAYLADTARRAGLRTVSLAMSDIGLRRGRFVDLEDDPIVCLFKLYPWEWLFQDQFGKDLSAIGAARFVEPIWKTMLSTKAILPLLWEMAPGHPNLLPARFADESDGVDVGACFVRKLCHAREGANILIVDDGRVVAETSGPYEGRAVLQTLAPLPNFSGNYPVLGSWLVGDMPCGLGIREDEGPITGNTSRFVPHAIIG